MYLNQLKISSASLSLLREMVHALVNGRMFIQRHSHFHELSVTLSRQPTVVLYVRQPQISYEYTDIS